ncbi:MAG: glycosyltransferase [Nocardioidaceae bacterium]
MSSLRIAQVANFVGPTSGGMRTAVEALGARYIAAGARRLLLTPGPSDTVEDTAAGTHVRLRSPKVSGGYRMIVEPWRVLPVLERFNPTSVEVSDKSTLLPLARWGRRRAVGCVLFSHERLDVMVALRTGWHPGVGAGIAGMNRWLSRLFDAVVVTSSFAADEFGQAASARLYRIPLGVDHSVFRPGVANPVRDGRLKLVHAGRLSREKSPDLAVATAVELHRRGVPIRLDVYGQGSMLDQLRRMAADAPVFFHGHVGGRPALARCLSAADIALSVCPGETFGLSILEALACGTPVVTADRGGGRELVTADSGAWGAPNAPALADAVLRLAERDEHARRRGARCRAEQFDWARTASSMLSVHERVGLARTASRCRVPGGSRCDHPRASEPCC